MSCLYFYIKNLSNTGAVVSCQIKNKTSELTVDLVPFRCERCAVSDETLSRRRQPIQHYIAVYAKEYHGLYVNAEVSRAVRRQYDTRLSEHEIAGISRYFDTTVRVCDKKSCNITTFVVHFNKTEPVRIDTVF